MNATTQKKRGRKPGTGAAVTADEVRKFWMMFRIHQARAIVMKNQGASDKAIERIMAPLAFQAMNILVGKAENLPDVKRYREKQMDRREPDALQKVKAAGLGVTRQTLLARRKKMDK